MLLLELALMLFWFWWMVIRSISVLYKSLAMEPLRFAFKIHLQMNDGYSQCLTQFTCSRISTTTSKSKGKWKKNCCSNLASTFFAQIPHFIHLLRSGPGLLNTVTLHDFILNWTCVYSSRIYWLNKSCLFRSPRRPFFILVPLDKPDLWCQRVLALICD